MSSPLPNMPGDFIFSDINWLNPDYNCPDTSPLILLSDGLFLNQQVSAPTVGESGAGWTSGYVGPP